MDPRRRKYIVITSVLLHVLFLLLWEGAIKLKIIGFNTAPEVVKENNPLIFDLQQPDRPREVIETPEDAKVVEKQKKANFLSDKNALARNPETNPNLKLDEAFARGDFKSNELPSIQGPLGKKQPQPKPIEKKKETAEEEKRKAEIEPDTETPDYLTESSATAFIKEYVMKQPNPTNPGVNEHLPTVTHDNPESRARDMGGLSFNTYDWNFAPYMLALKRRIQRNIFPPQAFTHLGMINGETLLRFKIYPNGEMRNLAILNYKGHKSLMETSHNAVNVSAPFPDLPPDFPEPYLEVTGKFLYFIRRQN